MHGIGAEEAIEVSRRHALDLVRDGACAFDEPALGVLGQRQAQNAARRVFQRRFDGMEAEEAQRSLVAVSRGGPVTIGAAGMVAMRRFAVPRAGRAVGG